MVSKAVILAAGRGTRMGAITEDLPKPMLPVQGRPLLEHIVERLGRAGIERFLIVVGYRRDAIEAHFAGRPGIEFRVQENVNGTGSAALLAREFVGDSLFFLSLGDILVDPAAYVACNSELLSHPKCGAVLGVKDVEDPWRAAAVYSRDGRVTKVIEKPPQGTSTTHWASAGLFAMRPTVFPYLDRLTPSARGEYELTAIFDPMLNDGIEVRMSAIEGRWLDVGRPEDLKTANLKG